MYGNLGTGRIPVTRQFAAKSSTAMGAAASSSRGASAAASAARTAPTSASSSSRSSASSDLSFSSSSSSAGAEVGVENGTFSPSLDPSSQASSASQLATVGNASGDASSEASCSDDAQVEIEPLTPSPTDWTSDDRCPYYPPRRDGCTEPRSCRDCLNVDVGGDYSCMVNQYGRCVQKRPGVYAQTLDVRNQQPSNDCEVSDEQKVQFPADEVDYCPYGDEQCRKCRRTVFQDVMQGQIDGSLTKFCYGENGCVCIAVCESPIWKSTIGQTVCNGTVVNKGYESQHANTYGGSTGSGGHGGPGLANLLMEIVGGVAAVVLVVAAVMYVRKRRRSASDDASSGSSSNSGSAQAGNAQGGDGDAAAGDVPMAVPVAAPHLSLFGWQAMRSELIEREQLLLAGVEDFSNVRTGYLQLLDVDASAPPPEEDESSAPVLLVPLAGASAPSFSPRGVAAFASAPSAPPASPSAPPASPTLLEEELL
ncbi:unnamed protein product [Phytophthora lilii]|uniref:Unnamed protein product n=1 Tax=Phytophthora lilii TaxID=2077276 RepID=A0A9W6TT96_9STRA|nr:unnamed protein product [Phytophthora lilii]